MQVYEAAPWGEGRADDRLTVLCEYILAPHLKEKRELPPTHHPYGADDLEDLAAMAEEYRRAKEEERATDGDHDRETERPRRRPHDVA